MRVAVAVAVSGGADSTALLLLAARTFHPDSITALSVDHGTRTAATGERARAAALACRLGVRFRALPVAPDGHGQARWRDARLGALVAYCRDAGIPTLWLGQNGDDAIETAAIRLLAKGPLESLAGIAAARDLQGVRIERPLLQRSAREIRRGLMAAGIGWTEDPSNRSLAYKRAAIRRTLAATPGNRATDAALVGRVAEWRARHDRAVAQAWRLAARPSPFGAVSFAAAAMAKLPASLRARLLRHAALMVAGHADRLRQADFEAAARLGPPAALGGAQLLCQGGFWWICRKADAIGRPAPLEPGMVWDRRCRVALAATPPPGDWAVGPLLGRRIGAMAELAPAPVLDSLPAIADERGIVAVPHLQIWRGRHGPFWAEHLDCVWTAAAEPPIFRLVP